MWNPFKTNVKETLQMMKNGLTKREDGTNNAFDVFVCIKSFEHPSKEASNRALCFAYWYGGMGLAVDFKPYFEEIRKPYLWNEDQKKAFAELPDKITLYRGVEKAEIENAGLKEDGKTLVNPSKCGISWTPKKRRARNFASYEDIYFTGNKQNLYGENPKDGYILKVEVDKQRLKTFYWFGRNQECVFLCRDTDKVTVDEKINDENRLWFWASDIDDDLFNLMVKHPHGAKDMNQEELNEFLNLMLRKENEDLRNLAKNLNKPRIKQMNDPTNWI